MKIYVACQKKNLFPLKKGYHNIHVGAKLSKEKLFECRDDIGDNISKKNPYYCELTGLYWMVKNTDDEIIGLNHYRRYFYNKIFVVNKHNTISEKQVEKILKKYDVIVPQPGYLLRSSVYNQYKNGHDINDLMLIENIIRKKYPDYISTFKKVIYSNNYHPFCMFIGKKVVIDEYSKWIFDILNEFEKATKEINKKVEIRTHGYIAERLFNVWLIKNNIKIKEKPVYNIEKPILKQEINAFLKLFIRRK